MITEVVTKIESIDEDTVSWSSLKTLFLFNIKKTINSAEETMSIAVHNTAPVFDLSAFMILIHLKSLTDRIFHRTD